MLQKDKATGKFKTLWNKKLKKKVHQLYVEEKLSLRRVAEELNVAHSTVQQLCERENWIRRKAMVEA